MDCTQQSSTRITRHMPRMKVVCCVQVWTENKDKGGATNFITGMGGFLQALLFGYGGVRLREKFLDFDPVLPPNCSKMMFTGIDYMGSSLSLTVVDRNMTITLTSDGPFPLCLIIKSTRKFLVLNQPVIVNSCLLYTSPSPRD